MALVVEDGSGSATAESYISESDADTYHSNRGNTAWAALSTAEKEILLRKATEYLDGKYSWLGSKYTAAQALQWPRSGAIVDGFTVDNNVIPAKLQQATAEVALLENSASLTSSQDRGGKVKRTKVDVIETEYMDGAPSATVYPKINVLLRGLYASSVDIVRA